MNSEVCQKKYYPLEDYSEITEDMFCLGSEDSHTCDGDSGGPVVDFNNGEDVELVGIVSWGQNMTCTEGPDVIINVINYRDWIETHVNPKINSPESNGFWAKLKKFFYIG